MKAGYRNTEAIILKKYRYSETSAIVKMLAEDTGRLDCIANGLYRKHRRFNAPLESLGNCTIRYFYKPNKNLYRLISADQIHYPFSITENYEKYRFSQKMIKVIYRWSVSSDTVPVVYSMTKRSIYEMERTASPQRVYIKFLLNFMIAEGVLDIHSGDNVNMRKLIADIFNERLGRDDTDRFILKLEQHMEKLLLYV
ncbi:MAG: DNA repair protein RecO [bacterium]